jgi:CRP/FNR family transcriptional regulator, anaerobic regulatory protein
MNFETTIKTALRKVYPFPEEQQQLVIEKIHLKSFKRNEFLLAPPATCSFAAFVIKGSFRMFKTTAEKENTLHFFTETDWIGDIESFVVQKPTENYIQATEKSEVALLSIHDIHQLIQQVPVFLSLGRIMKGWSVHTGHYTSLINDTPEDRYRALLGMHPEWILRFPQMHLASYLGMTRETFSRAKRKAVSARQG